jgi:hypothetical protein
VASCCESDKGLTLLRLSAKRKHKYELVAIIEGKKTRKTKPPPKT